LTAAKGLAIITSTSIKQEDKVMASIQVSPNSSRLKALKFALEMNIDMLNDMATDPMWYNPTDLRMLAGKSDEEIRTTMHKNCNEVYENIDRLIALQFLHAELNEIK